MQRESENLIHNFFSLVLSYLGDCSDSNALESQCGIDPGPLLNALCKLFFFFLFWTS